MHGGRFSYQMLASVSFSGLMCGLSIIFPPLWWIIWFAPMPYFYILLSERHTQKLNQALLIGMAFGFTLNLSVSASAWSAYPLDWVGIPSPLASVLIIGGISIGSSLCMGIAQMLFAGAIFALRSRVWHAVVLIVVLPCMWAFAEWSQAILFSFYALGPTSTINAYSQVASIGYALGNAESGYWIALARWGGLPLLAMFPVLVSALSARSILARGHRDECYRWAARATLVVMLFLVSSSLAAQDAALKRGASGKAWKNTSSLRIVASKTDFPAQFVQTQDVLVARNDIVYATAQELRRLDIRPDAIVFPETIGNWLDGDSYARISALFPAGMLLVHSKYGEGRPRTAKTYSHVIGGATAVTDKRYIMPYGEYPPYHFLELVRFLSPDIYANLLEHREYVGGTKDDMGAAHGVKIGVRLCSEIFAPALYRSLANEDAGVLIQSSSIKIFDGTPILQWTMRSAARIRAVENGLPLIQTMNGAPGSAFDCTGKELSPVLETKDFRIYDISRMDACRQS